MADGDLGRAYVNIRSVALVGLTAVGLVFGALSSLFGDGVVHLISEAPVEAWVDGQPVTLQHLSPWHHTVELPSGKHAFAFRVNGDETALEATLKSGSAYLLPLRGQCAVWIGWAINQPRVFRRITGAPEAIEIPQGSYFGNELPQRLSAPPPALFNFDDCDRVANASDAELLSPR